MPCGCFVDLADGRNWVSFGNGGGIYSSPDALRWTQQPSGATQLFWDCEFNGSQWVAVGSTGVTAVSDFADVTCN